jgi:hypothetical protein
MSTFVEFVSYNAPGVEEDRLMDLRRDAILAVKEAHPSRRSGFPSDSSSPAASRRSPAMPAARLSSAKRHAGAKRGFGPSAGGGDGEVVDIWGAAICTLRYDESESAAQFFSRRTAARPGRRRARRGGQFDPCRLNSLWFPRR